MARRDSAVDGGGFRDDPPAGLGPRRWVHVCDRRGRQVREDGGLAEAGGGAHPGRADVHGDAAKDEVPYVRQEEQET